MNLSSVPASAPAAAKLSPQPAPANPDTIELPEPAAASRMQVAPPKTPKLSPQPDPANPDTIELPAAASSTARPEPPKAPRLRTQESSDGLILDKNPLKLPEAAVPVNPPQSPRHNQD